MLFPVILSGGVGTRLWPVSRQSLPKQFVKLVSPNRTLLQMTLERLNDLTIEKAGCIVVANKEHKFLVSDQLSEVGADIGKIILEPLGKSTAPAIALAAIWALKISPDAKLLVQTADHIIPNQRYFCDLIAAAILANQPMITFGISPTRPEVGYGYIEVGSAIGESGAFEVNQFIEKPKIDMAKHYLDSGRYLWNSGIFLINARVYLNELKRLNPAILLACEASISAAVEDSKYLYVDRQAFEACPSVSVDYAVIEKSDQVTVMPFKDKWSDLGAWDAVLDEMPSDENENVVIGNGFAHRTSKTLIRSEGRLVVALGVSDLLILETADVMLISSKSAAQDVKQVVNLLRQAERPEVDNHLIGYRPWGSYQSVIRGDHFQVKKIIVKPGKALSLQAHQHRAEHWVVVEGVAEVINGDITLLLEKNQSTYIPVGVKHRLSNFGQKDLVIIEVQTGSYLGEDDIERFDDLYGRI